MFKTSRLPSTVKLLQSCLAAGVLLSQSVEAVSLSDLVTSSYHAGNTLAQTSSSLELSAGAHATKEFMIDDDPTQWLT